MTKSLTRKELAEAAGVSVRVLNEWINDYMDELKKLGYKKRKKYFTPAQVHAFCEHYCIDLEEMPP